MTNTIGCFHYWKSRLQYRSISLIWYRFCNQYCISVLNRSSKQFYAQKLNSHQIGTRRGEQEKGQTKTNATKSPCPLAVELLWPCGPCLFAQSPRASRLPTTLPASQLHTPTLQHTILTQSPPPSRPAGMQLQGAFHKLAATQQHRVAGVAAPEDLYRNSQICQVSNTHGKAAECTSTRHHSTR